MGATRAVQSLAPTAAADDVVAVLAEDGCVVVERLVPPETMDEIHAELAPHLDATAAGPDEFSGLNTRRTGSLIARSPGFHPIASHPLVLGTLDQVLGEHATNYQLHLTQVIDIGPGEPAQLLHRDQWAFDFFPFPTGYEVQCNTIWAMTDFTEANGATRVIPGSHRLEDRREFFAEDTEPAEMAAGSVLFYTGALYHGAGANRADHVRIGVNVTYAVSWLRQEENQYLSCPAEIARGLPEPLLRLMGYARGAYALGYVDDMRDPLAVLRGDAGTGVGLGDLDAATTRARSTAR